MPLRFSKFYTLCRGNSEVSSLFSVPTWKALISFGRIDVVEPKHKFVCPYPHPKAVTVVGLRLNVFTVVVTDEFPAVGGNYRRIAK